MKKTYLLLTILATLPLVSCGGEDSSSTPTNQEIKETTAENVLATLNEIKAKKNYQIDYAIDKVAQRDILTENYLYYQSQKIGAAKLENVDKSVYQDDKILYSFEVSDKGEVEVVRPIVDSRGVPYFNPYQLDYFQLLGEEGYVFSNSDFATFGDEGALYSSNDSLIYIVACSVGRGSAYTSGSYSGVDFLFEEDGLHVCLLKTDDNGALKEIDGTRGVISNIGTAKDDTIEAFFAPSYSLGEELSEDASEMLLSSSLHSETRISTYDGTNRTLSNTIVVDYDENNLRATVSSSSAKQEATYSRGKDGNAVKKYLDGRNKVAEDAWTSESFDTYVKKSKDFFKRKEFRKINDNTYRYFGLDANTLLFPYCQIDLSSYSFSTVDVTLGANGKVSSIEATTDLIASSSDSSSYYQMIFAIDGFKTADTIASKTPLTPIQGIDSELKTAFDTFKNKNNNVKIHFIDDMLGGDKYQQYTDYYFTSSVILRDMKYAVTTSNPNTDDHEYSGYYETGNGVSGFYINKKNDTIAPTSTADKNDSIANHWLDKTFTLSTDVFEKDTSDETGKTYKIRDGVDDISNQLAFLSNKETSNLDPSTFVMKLDASGRISEIHYTFVSMATRNATLTFEYSSNLEIPTYVTEKLASVKKWVVAENWEQENEGIYDQLVELFGKEFADLLPYYFTEDTVTNWRFVREASSIILYNTYRTEYYFNLYYKGELLKKGFDKVSENVFENKTYKVRIEFGKDTSVGMTLSKID
mgnify:CR=1 FL=1